MLWEEENGLVFYKGKLYIPNDRTLRKDIVKSCHDAPLARHAGKNGTLELVQRNYWWPCMATYVSNYVEGCEKCQCYRRDHHPTVPVQPQKVPEGPWQTIGVDLITGLPISHGKNAILNLLPSLHLLLLALNARDVPEKSGIQSNGQYHSATDR